mmetsp:Transcript_63589/g.177976  ORF Transcript_63589/g.177976 Transcript_63589/m.177976 type:complete len:239 (-) Transcript_63589:392-1108(-)
MRERRRVDPLQERRGRPRALCSRWSQRRPPCRRGRCGPGAGRRPPSRRQRRRWRAPRSLPAPRHCRSPKRTTRRRCRRRTSSGRASSALSRRGPPRLPPRRPLGFRARRGRLSPGRRISRTWPPTAPPFRRRRPAAERPPLRVAPAAPCRSTRCNMSSNNSNPREEERGRRSPETRSRWGSPCQEGTRRIRTRRRTCPQRLASERGTRRHPSSTSPLGCDCPSRTRCRTRTTRPPSTC